MSISGLAFWSSDYAYEIMGAKSISSPVRDFPQEIDADDSSEEKFEGFKPRIDEYIPSNAKQKDEQKPENENSSGEKPNGEQYSEEEQKIIAELKARDQEVRTHEQAHIAAGGAHIRGGATYTTQTGPDGRQYAIGGEVSIDTSPVKDSPEATIAKMQAVKSAAMAPANPSGADRAVAAAASQIEAAARTEIAEKRREEQTPEVENKESGETTAINTEKVQNQITAAISAYTNNYGTGTLSSKIDFAA